MYSKRREDELRRYTWRVVEVCIMLLFIIVFALLLGRLMKYILPFMVGWIFAILLMPVVRWLEHVGLPRLTAVLSTLIFTVALVIAVSTAIVVGAAREASSFLVHSKSVLHIEHVLLQQQLTTTSLFAGQLPTQVTNQIQNSLSHLTNMMQHSLQKFVTSLGSSVTHLPGFLFIGVIAIVTAFFILLRRERMLLGFYQMLPPGWDEKMEIILADMSRAFLGSIRVQFILMCMSAALGVIGMYLLHIPYAVLLGIIFGLTGLVPILGSALLTVPWAAGALILGDTSMALKVISLQVLISIIRHMVEPKLLADTVGLNTLMTLFALYIGLQTMGIIGLFIGPIILIGAKGLLRTHLFVDFLPYQSPDEEDNEEES